MLSQLTADTMTACAVWEPLVASGQHVATCRGVMGAIMKGGYLWVPSEALVSVLELHAPLLIQGANRLAQVPIGPGGVEVQACRGVVGQHPGEDWLLVEIIDRAPR